jgi:hypothetical protein
VRTSTIPLLRQLPCGFTIQRCEICGGSPFADEICSGGREAFACPSRAEFECSTAPSIRDWSSRRRGPGWWAVPSRDGHTSKSRDCWQQPRSLLVILARKQPAGRTTVFQRTVARCFQLLALSLAVLPSVVCAQGEPHMGSPQQQRACRADVLRHCRGVHEDLAIANCLKANVPKLHLACRQIVEDGTR